MTLLAVFQCYELFTFQLTQSLQQLQYVYLKYNQTDFNLTGKYDA